MNVPILLTLLRIALIPLFVATYLLPVPWSFSLSAALFLLASVTDWLDGFLARRWRQTTRFGAFLDPVADKLMVAAALVLLAAAHHSVWLTVPAVVIVGREILISALREWMAEMNRRGLVRVGLPGKIKTVAQVVAILALLANPPEPDRAWVLAGYVMINVAAVLTLWSMFQYLRAAWPAMRSGMRPDASGGGVSTPGPAIGVPAGAGRPVAEAAARTAGVPAVSRAGDGAAGRATDVAGVDGGAT
jgi:CDP-diacylglycerol--glycerol-3-phosphate 3-phosphatidyltransferase